MELKNLVCDAPRNLQKTVHLRYCSSAAVHEAVFLSDSWMLGHEGDADFLKTCFHSFCGNVIVSPYDHLLVIGKSLSTCVGHSRSLGYHI